MAKQLMDLGKLCEALGVDRPNEVTRVVVDIRSGDIPMLYVERIADTEKIIAALTGPGIELRRESAAKVTAKVEFCNWCPIPAFPDTRFHPDGGPEHREAT